MKTYPKIKQIIQEGNQGDILVIGFPYDEGAKRSNFNLGTAKAPDCFRSFLYKLGSIVNLELEISLHQMRIGDYGNISNQSECLQEIHATLQNLLTELFLSNQVRVPYSIGGSRDISIASWKALLHLCQEKSYSPVIISIDAHPDVYHFNSLNQVHSGSIFRNLLESEEFTRLGGQFLLIGNQGSQNGEADIKFIQAHNGELHWLRKIRRTQIERCESLREPTTQAGQYFKKVLDRFGENHRIVVSWDMDSIDSVYFPGVNFPSTEGGLTNEQAVQIAFQIGRNPKVVSCDTSEFNPEVESIRSGRLAFNIFYYFLLGVALRKPNLNNQ